MKIGILTFHCAHNYGAVLQCYALQEILKNLGHEVEVIDYRPEYLVAPYRVFSISRFLSRNPLKMLKACIRESLLLPKRIKRYVAFQSFINNNFNLSQPIVANNIPSKYDVYIMGSDQIWNPNITRGFDPVYFGYFDFEKGNKTYISYAASMEAEQLDSDSERYLKKALMNFDAISVREVQLKTLLQPLTEKEVVPVLDPTLLVNKNTWDKMAQEPNVDKKYVLIYQVRQNSNVVRIAQNLAESIDAEIVEITSSPKTDCFINNRQGESPAEFLGWIKNAQCVVTTSFHGTAFSILFNRPFFCIKLDDDNDTRSLSLLKSLKLEDRFIDREEMPAFSLIDYSEPNIQLSYFRTESMNYLSSSLDKLW